jgi:NADPH:quinone reductase-like Zn-dependent oxidoreductase
LKAINYEEYGSPEVLKIKETDMPVPKDNEILIRVHATSVNYGDLVARKFKYVTWREFNMPTPLLYLSRLMFGWNKPKKKILGSEFAGEVEATGKSVKQFTKGDPVFGYVGQNMGTNAEYMCMPENGTVAIKPENISYEEACVIPYGALMAMNHLRKVNVKKGQKVLINGASGSIGSAAIQLVKYYGAEVTGVCGTPRLEFVKSLGADKVIDYTKEDFTQNGKTYDVIYDILGKNKFDKCKNSLTDNGIYLLASFKMKQILQMLWTKLSGSKKKVICALATDTVEDLNKIKELVRIGEIKTIIDKIFPMDKAVEAHRYIEEGQKKGNVVITLNGSMKSV